MALDVAPAVPVGSAAEFAARLEERGATARERIVAISNQASGKQTVTFEALLDEALCRGWIDTQPKTIDAERYAIRFVPR